MYLLDTNVISQLVASKPALVVLDWIEAQDENTLFLSVVTIGEIQQGIARLPPSRKRTLIATWLQKDLIQRFSHRIIPLDTQIMFAWGTLVGSLSRTGHNLPAIDSLIAATAQVKQLIIVTRNSKDFHATDIPTLNPWEYRT